MALEGLPLGVLQLLSTERRLVARLRMSQNNFMRTQLNLLLAFGAMSCFSALPQNSVPSKAELKTIILRSRHLGAHGMGYNDDSLTKLSRTITPDDIPNLISLLGDRELRAGAQFALASQCEASIKPVHDATIHSEAIASLDA